MNSPMTKCEDIKNYIFSSRDVCLTLQSVRSGKRFTYRFQAVRSSPNLQHVQLLTGSDNETDYVQIGTLRDSYMGLRFSPALGTLPKLPLHAFAWFVDRLKVTAEIDPTQLQVWHDGHCARCGRLLTTPESIETGMGPKCRARS